MPAFIILILNLPITPVITDREAGYDQAAYDECLDSMEEQDCDDLDVLLSLGDPDESE